MAESNVRSIRDRGEPSQVKRHNLAVYVEWILTPETEREPKTKKDLAEAMGLTTQTLRNYAKDPWVRAELARRSRGLYVAERAQDVIDELHRIATGTVDSKPSERVSAAKVLLDWADKQVSEVAGSDLSELSNDELKAMLVEMIDVLEANG